MKKKVMMTIGAMTIAAIIGLLFSQSLFASADPDLTDADIREKVESQYPGDIIEIELENDRNNPVYEIELHMEGQGYELIIDANSGKVVKLDEKMERSEEEQSASFEIREKEQNGERKTPQAPERTESKEDKSKKQQSAGEEDERNTFIHKEEAIQIAQEQFSGKVDDVELETEDGRLIYEIEIESSRGEAEIEIDAITGKVLMVDIDLDD